MLARPTSSTSAALQTSISASLVTSALPHTAAISASLVTSSALPTPSTTSDEPLSVLQSSETSSSLSVSKPSNTNGSDLGTGAIAGIVVGVVVFAGLAAALIFVLCQRRKSKNVQADSPASFQSHVPVRFVGEKDGTPLRLNELSGDSQPLEMATNNR